MVEITAEHRCAGGRQLVLSHDSAETGTAMAFSLFLPPAAEREAVPLLTYLSGLTCTWENVTTKGGFQRSAAEHGLAVLCPDTSPRGLDLPFEHDAYDFGTGAGFYVDASEPPWSAHYRMWSYVTGELPGLVADRFSLDLDRHGITGHSMGGHGALTIGLALAERYRSVSAFSPIGSPTRCPWGEKALGGYLGRDRTAWRRHDATLLLEDGHTRNEILVDIGTADGFLDSQLRPDLLEAAAAKAGQTLTLRRQPGYDHSYYFVASFLPEHLAWHAGRLV